MKFSNFLSNLGHFFVMAFFFIFDVLLLPALIVFLIIVGFNTNIFIAGAMLIPILIGVYSIPLNWFLGKVSGAEFYNTGYVGEGRSVIDIVRDEAYYKRAIYVNFVIMGLFVLAIFYFVFVMTESFGWCLAGLIQSIVGAILYFLFAMSAIEKSRIKNKGKMDKEEFAQYFKNLEPIKKEIKVKTKFNFEKYPEMKELYLSYKQSKNRAIHLNHESSKVEDYKQECAKRDELFEKLSKSVYETFNEQKPDLINKKTNEKVKWEALFDVDFEKLTYKQKDTIIRLLDANPYKFENDKLYNE